MLEPANIHPVHIDQAMTNQYVKSQISNHLRKERNTHYRISLTSGKILAPVTFDIWLAVRKFGNICKYVRYISRKR